MWEIHVCSSSREHSDLKLQLWQVSKCDKYKLIQVVVVVFFFSYPHFLLHQLLCSQLQVILARYATRIVFMAQIITGRRIIILVVIRNWGRLSFGGAKENLILKK